MQVSHAMPRRSLLSTADSGSCVGLQEHPDTVGGAFLTGVREAVRALHLLREDDPETAGDAADLVASEDYRPRKKVCVGCHVCCTQAAGMHWPMHNAPAERGRPRDSWPRCSPGGHYRPRKQVLILPACVLCRVKVRATVALTGASPVSHKSVWLQMGKQRRQADGESKPRCACGEQCCLLR